MPRYIPSSRSAFRILPTVLLPLSLAAEASAQAPSYSVEFLGSAINAASMNDSGQVVGTVSSPTTRGWVAGPGAPLTLLPLPPGRISGWANDINDGGAIAGAVSSSVSPSFGGVAAVWYPNGSGGYDVVELGLLPGHQSSSATALNDVGDIVGSSVKNSFSYPVLFAAPGVVQDLSSTGIFDPRDINDQRVLVDGSFTAKRLDLNTMVVTDLGVPTGLPQNYLATYAAAINESSQVCGSAILTTSTSCDRQAARYTDGVGWQIFSSCGPYNGAVDMNDRGDLVMQLNLAPYVHFEGLGTFKIEDLIHNTVGTWYVINGYGLTIDNLRRMVVPATNQVTGEGGLVLLTPESGEPVSTYCTGKTSSAGCTPVMTTAGVPSASSPAAFDLLGQLVINQKAGLLFYGLTPSSAPFAGGIKCVGAPTKRTPLLDSGGNPPPDDCSGLLRYDFNQRIQSGSDPELVPGTTVYAQYYYRDPFSSFTVGLTSAASFTIQP